MLIKIDDALIASIRRDYGSQISSLNLSKNGLEDLGSLSQLSSLTRINLSRNKIHDLHPLHQLTALRELDLSENSIGNRIRSVRDLEGPLPALLTLVLTGNPVTASLDYPQEIFLRFPSLQKLDTWDRQQVLKNSNPFLPSHSTPTTLPTSSAKLSNNRSNNQVSTTLPLPPIADKMAEVSSQVSTASGKVAESRLYDLLDSSDIDHLKAHLQSLQQSMQLQEELIAGEAPAESRIALQRTIRTVAQLSSSGLQPVRLQPILLEGGETSATSSSTKKEFPFGKLLSLWRKKVVQLQIQHTFLEREHQQQLQQQRLERQEWQEKVRRAEGQVMKFQQLYNLQLEQQALYEKQLTQQQTQHRDLEEKYRSLEKRHNEYCGVVHQLLASLPHWQKEIEKQWLIDRSVHQKILQQCDKQIEKVSRMIDQVIFVEEVVEEEKISLRNSYAALEAEKRLFLSRQSTTSVSATSRNSQESSVSKAGSHLMVKAEGEALLRGIFRSLDREDRGLVAVDGLLRLLVESTAPVDKDLCSSSTIMFGSEGGGEQKRILSELGDIVRNALGNEVFIRLLRGLELSQEYQDELTWGECLLLLLSPSPTSNPQSQHPSSYSSTVPPILSPGSGLLGFAPLSMKEARHLSEQGLFGDKDSSLPAFDISSLPLALTSSSNSISNSISNPTNQSLVKRLQEERKFLLHRLQVMQRSLLHRAEGIKAYFEQELRCNQVQLVDYRHRLEEEQSRSAEQAKEVNILTMKLQELTTKHQEEILDFVKQQDFLKEELAQIKQKQYSNLEDRLLEEKERTERHEKENVILQKEIAKQNIKIKTLQRELCTLQALHHTLEDDLAKAKHEKRKEDEVFEDLKRANEQLAAEKSSLESQLQGMESELSLLKEARKDSEEVKESISSSNASVPAQVVQPLSQSFTKMEGTSLPGSANAPLTSISAPRSLPSPSVDFDNHVDTTDQHIKTPVPTATGASAYSVDNLSRPSSQPALSQKNLLSVHCQRLLLQAERLLQDKD
eukprot:gene10227-11321_t